MVGSYSGGSCHADSACKGSLRREASAIPNSTAATDGSDPSTPTTTREPSPFPGAPWVPRTTTMGQ